MTPPLNKTIGEYELVKTCDGHPEQYDVYLEKKLVGYLRLRHGYFRAMAPDIDGTMVFSSNPFGDGYFHDDEREIHLNAAIASIDVFLKKPKEELNDA